tara:strand:+ start:521 stop:676 length:156 start_codon:yes stop_codon:yes gene_type:complete
MIKVYAESNNHAELWATFKTEEIYNLCYPLLVIVAERDGMIITESMENEDA